MPSPPSTGGSPLVAGTPLPALTGIRFVAAFAVVLCHFGTYLFPGAPEVVVRLLAGLFNGVGFFFMLSGFILAHTYGERFETGRASLQGFYRARFARVYPAYVFALLLGLPSFFIAEAARSPAKVAEFGLVKFLLLQSWIPIGAFTKQWNPPTWSISTELFFYLVFPFVVLPILRLDLRRTVGLFVLLTLAVIAVALAYDFALHAQDGVGTPLRTFLLVSPIPRLADFLLGIATYRIATTWPGVAAFSTNARRVSWLAIAAAIGLVLLTNLHVAKSQGLLFPFFALALLLLAAERGRVARFFSRPLLVRLGEESYALYLVHFAIGEIFVRFWNAAGHAPLQSPIGSVTFGLAVIAASLVVAHWTHRLIEAPGRRWLLRRPSTA